MAEKDVDEQFAAIMAHWDDVALGRDPYGDTLGEREPEGSDPGDGSAQSAESGTPVETREDNRPTVTPQFQAEIHTVRDVSDLPELDDTEDVDDAATAYEDDEDEHYTPPPPAPLPPSEDKHFWIMVVALVAGPLMFLYLLLFNRDGNGWWMMLALLVSIAGFVLLVLRQPIERDEDDHGIRL